MTRLPGEVTRLLGEEIVSQRLFVKMEAPVETPSVPPTPANIEIPAELPPTSKLAASQ